MPVTIRVKHDLPRIIRRIKGWERQVPFATSLALNNTAFEARKYLLKLWDRTFPQRKNPRFPAVAFRVKKSNKRRLVASVYDRLRLNLFDLQIKGGIKRPYRSKYLLIPDEKIVRFTKTGRPTATWAPGKMKRAWFVSPESDSRLGPGIWQRRGKKRLPIRRPWVVAKSAQVRPSGFSMDKAKPYVRRRFRRNFRRAIVRALRTAR